MAFHKLETNNIVKDIQQGVVKQFEGDGTPFLNIGKAKKINSIRIGGINLPKKVTDYYPHPRNPDRTIPIRSELWATQTDSNDNVIVLRSIQSNDGIWQEGAKIFILGEWEEEIAQEPIVESEQKPKMAKAIK